MNIFLFPQTGEIDLSGSRTELLGLADLIAAGTGTIADHGGIEHLDVATPLCRVHVTATATKVIITARPDTRSLDIAGAPEHLRVLAENLRAIGEADEGGHLHVDPYPDHPYLDDTSQPLVINSPHGGMPAVRPARDNTMHADPAPSHQLVQRYFQMWNTGDTSIAPQVLSPDWADHAHPEVNGPADVQRAVTQTRTARPGLQFHIETILGDGDLLSVVGGVGHQSRPDTIDSRLIWLIRLFNGQMVEMWTYRLNTP